MMFTCLTFLCLSFSDRLLCATGVLDICRTLRLLDNNMHFKGLSKPRCSFAKSGKRCSEPTSGQDLCEYHQYLSETEHRVAFTIWAVKQLRCAVVLNRDIPTMRSFLLQCLYTPPPVLEEDDEEDDQEDN